MQKLLYVILLTAICSSSGYAAIIRGRVLDLRTGEALAGVTVQISELGKGTVSGLDGSYELRNIPEGWYTVSVSSLSYVMFSQRAEVKGAGETVLLNITLTPAQKERRDAIVTMRNSGATDAGARHLEKKSDNILNITGCGGEILQHCRISPWPTIAADVRDDGWTGALIWRRRDTRRSGDVDSWRHYPRSPTRSRFRAPVMGIDISTERTYFPSKGLQRLKVIWSLGAADMEGDAIGGVMNLVLKDAPEHRVFNAQGALGYSQMLFNQSFTSYDHGAVNSKSPGELSGPNYIPPYSDFSYRNLVFTNGHPLPDGQLGFTAGNRFLHQRLGVIVSGSIQSTDRISKDLFFSLSPQPDPIPNGTQPEITDEEPRTYSIHEDRIGAHAKPDYRFDARNHISLYTVLMQLNTYQSRYYSDSSETQRSAPGLGVVSYDYLSRTNLQSIYNATLQGQHAPGDHWTVDWSAVYSHAQQHTPDRAELTTSQTFVPDPATRTVAMLYVVIPILGESGP